MSIQNITIRNHKINIDNESHYKTWLQTAIRNNFKHANFNIVEVYGFNNENTLVTAGDQHRFIILMGATGVHESGKLITLDGKNIASYLKVGTSCNVLNIFEELLTVCNDTNKARIEEILKAIDEQIFLQEYLDKSWKSTTKRNELTAEFQKRMSEQAQRTVTQDTRKVEEITNDIQYYTQELKNKFDRRIALLSQIELAQSRLDKVNSKVIAELDNIVNHPKVTELFLEDGKFIVHTAPIYAYHDVTGDRYYIGNMKIEMNPLNTNVKFFGDNPRRSYWSDKDPHPHVSSSGSACLGNVSATIAELCSQYELYALTMICIDFLESVNTADPAGANIKHWDMVDEEGNIIQEGSEEVEYDWYCDYCDDGHTDDDAMYTVYESYTGGSDGHGDWGAERFVCESCREGEYNWEEDLQEYVRDGNCNIIEPEEEEDDEEDIEND